jgi:hypothetical protein
MATPFVNPYCEKPEVQLLRERSETFNRVDDVFRKVSNVKTVLVVFFACVATLSVANLGSSVWANVLTRNVNVNGNQLQNAVNGKTVGTAAAVVQGAVRECDAYDAILDASSITVGYAHDATTNAFSAKVASVLTVPSAQSMCGFYLLVKTLDPIFDVVVSDNATTLVPKANADAITYMLLPTKGIKGSSLSATSTSHTSVVGNAFTAAQTVSSSSSASVLPTTAVDSSKRNEFLFRAASLWAVAAFLRGDIKCGDTVEQAAIPVMVQDSSMCAMSSAQLNAIANVVNTVDLDRAILLVDETPTCSVTIASYVTDLENAIPASCADELQMLMHAAGVSTTSSNQELAGQVQGVIAHALASSAKRRTLLKALPCGSVATSFNDANLAIGVGIGCLISNAQSFFSDVFKGGSSGGRTHWKDLYTPFQ